LRRNSRAKEGSIAEATLVVALSRVGDKADQGTRCASGARPQGVALQQECWKTPASWAPRMRATD